MIYFLVLVPFILFIYAYFIETKLFEQHEVELTTNKIKYDLKILHISDLHLCQPESSKIEFLKKVTSQDLDLIFITGDIFENYSGLQYIDKIITKKPNINAYAVLGNHDYYDYKWINKTLGKIIKKLKHPSQFRDIDPILESLKDSRIKVLRNQVDILEKYQIAIIGIDYPTISYNKLKELNDSIPDQYFKIVLFHIPLNISNITKLKFDIGFGGHTHGGQVRLPIIGAIFTDSELAAKNACGLFKIEDTYFHISNGVGADPKSNIRFLCRPSATILQLKSQNNL